MSKKLINIRKFGVWIAFDFYDGNSKIFLKSKEIEEIYGEIHMTRQSFETNGLAVTFFEKTKNDFSHADVDYVYQISGLCRLAFVQWVGHKVTN